MTNMISIDISEHQKLIEQVRMLRCLIDEGVEEWGGYSYALERFNKLKLIDQRYELFIDLINDVLAEASVSEPAGHRCGYAIEFNEDFVKQHLRYLVNDINKLSQGE